MKVDLAGLLTNVAAAVPADVQRAIRFALLEVVANIEEVRTGKATAREFCDLYLITPRDRPLESARREMEAAEAAAEVARQGLAAAQAVYGEANEALLDAEQAHLDAMDRANESNAAYAALLGKAQP